MARERNKATAGAAGSAPKTGRRAAVTAAAEKLAGLTGQTEVAGLAGLEATLGYQFAKPALLRLALTHRSHPYEARLDKHDGGPGRETADVAVPVLAARDTRNPPGTDNEQLEFVGDAVLEMAVTELLFQQFPKQSEGELTRMRASLVSRQRMATMGAELGLDEHLLVGRSAEQNGARKKPALLANAAEAVLAAVYLDAVGSGKDGLAEVRRLVEQRLLRPELATMRAALKSASGRGAMRDAKTVLQERVQAEGAGRLRYADTEQSGPAHQRRFTVEARLEQRNGVVAVLASAEGCSKKEAQQRAAELALQGWARTGSAEASQAEAAASEDAA